MDASTVPTRDGSTPRVANVSLSRGRYAARFAFFKPGAANAAVVPAAGVIGEAMVALVLAEAALEKFGGDSLPETRRNFEGYLAQVRRY